MDNKTLIDNIASSTGESRDEVQALISQLTGIMAKCCLDMDIVIIPGFGQFEAKKRKERLTIHPATGQRLMIPPKMVVNFRPSGVLKGRIGDSVKE